MISSMVLSNFPVFTVDGTFFPAAPTVPTKSKDPTAPTALTAPLGGLLVGNEGTGTGIAMLPTGGGIKAPVLTGGGGIRRSRGDPRMS